MKQIIVLSMLLLFVIALNAQSVDNETKIVGTLNYGQTSGQIPYKDTPKYRAFRFRGKKGDKIEVWVQSLDGDPVASIYDSEFKKLAFNDDADSTVLNSHIKLTLPGPDTITYYIIFREYSYNSATFVVSLKLQSDPGNIILFGGKQKKKNIITRQEVNDSILNDQPWEIKEDPELKGLGGEVILDMPDKLSFHAHLMFYEAGDTKTQVASWFSSNSSKLLPGLYDISVDSKYTIKNVPVEKGKRTRLKMGVLSVSSYGSFELENSNHEKISYAPPFSIILPEGIYYVLGKKKFKIEIKDGELTEL
jgi:hypothetical protein